MKEKKFVEAQVIPMPKKRPAPKPDYKAPKMLLQKMEEFKAAKLNRTGSDHNNVRFAFLESSGALVYNLRHMCHQSLMYDEKTDPIAIIQQVQEVKVKKDVAGRYYEWLFNYSPFRSAFITKDTEEVLRDAVFIVDTDTPSNLMTGGLMASRLTWENYTQQAQYRRLVLWDKLVERGLHPHAAFVLSHHLKPNSKLDGVYVEATGGHLSLATSQKGRLDQTFWNFLNETPKEVGGPYRKDKSYAYGGINSMWYKPVGAATSVFDIIQVTLNRVGKLKEKKKKNIFAVSRDNEFGSTVFPINETVEEIVLQITPLLNNHKVHAIAA